MTKISLIPQIIASDVFDFVCGGVVRGSELHRAIDVGSDYFEESIKSLAACAASI